jgi:hypothetical protein
MAVTENTEIIEYLKPKIERMIPNMIPEELVILNGLSEKHNI